jgi:hypothetical protein
MLYYTPPRGCVCTYQKIFHTHDDMHWIVVERLEHEEARLPPFFYVTVDADDGKCEWMDPLHVVPRLSDLIDETPSKEWGCPSNGGESRGKFVSAVCCLDDVERSVRCFLGSYKDRAAALDAHKARIAHERID